MGGTAPKLPLQRKYNYHKSIEKKLDKDTIHRVLNGINKSSKLNTLHK